MKLKNVLLASALLASVSAARSMAGPVLDWDPAYFWQIGATPTNAPLGGELKVVGIISDFGPPLDFLNAHDPSREYTFYVYGLISQGTVQAGPPSTTFYTTDYSGGTIEVYEDLTPEAVFAPNPPNGQVPSTFIDGTLLLSGNFTSFYTQTNNFTPFQTGNAEGEINWTGGSLIDLTRTGGRPCPGLFTGGMTWRADVNIPGYLFRHDGKIDFNCPVPSQNSTWGRVKSLYHR